jgi:hypothetical protein
MAAVVPYVLLLDLDGTIQGDISPQIQETNLLKALNLKQNSKFLKSDYTRGLLRPYFKDFITEIFKSHANVELFVYTASEKKWAHQIVGVIESIIGRRFNRPIFTREDCKMTIEQHKSLAHVKPKILKSLRKKYDSVYSEEMLTGKMYLIDNNHVLKEKEYLLKCPTYNHAVLVDVLRNINMDKRIQHHKQISKFCSLDISNNLWEMYKNVYLNLYEKSKQCRERNHKLKDAYWKKVTLLFNAFKPDYERIFHAIKFMGQS